MPAWTSASITDSDSDSASDGAVAVAHTGSAAARVVRPTRQRRPSRLGLTLFLLCASPALLLVWRWTSGRLGVDPLNAAIHGSGWWALTLLLLTLCITPLRRLSVWSSRRVSLRWGRRLSDWNLLIRQRRQLGLWSFAYASAHLALYIVLDAGSWQELCADLLERPFIGWGMTGFLLLLPLAATSTNAAMRRLKRNWARLHLLVYPAAGVALLHAWLQTKVGHDLPLGFVLAAAALAACRLWARWAGDPVGAGEVEATRPTSPRMPADRLPPAPR